MTKLLYAVGTSFLRAFGVGLLTFSTGILAAPNKSVAVSLSIAALLGSLAMGLRAVQVFLPMFSWAGLIKSKVVAALADSFTRAFLASFIVTITGWLAAPDLVLWKSVFVGAIVGALTAGVRVLQGVLTPGETPAPNTGVVVPADQVVE